MTHKKQSKRGRPARTAASTRISNFQRQPSRVELEADMSIPTTPDKLLKSVINYNPRKDKTSQ